MAKTDKTRIFKKRKNLADLIIVFWLKSFSKYMPPRPFLSNRQTASAPFLLLLFMVTAAVLTGCLELELYMEINENQSGYMRAEYQVGPMASRFSTIENRKRYLSIPLTETEIEEAADEFNITLLDVDIAQHNNNQVAITIEAEFLSFEDFNGFWGGPNRLSFQEDEGSNIFELFLYPGTYEPEPEEEGSLIEENHDLITLFQYVYPEESISVRLRAPGPVEAVNFGFLDDDIEIAYFERTLESIISSREPVVWSVRF